MSAGRRWRSIKPRPRPRPPARVLLALALLCPAAPALAAEDAGHPPIRVTIDPCVPVEEQGVQQVVAVELGALITGADAGAGVTRVEAGCAEGRIRLRVDDPVTGKSLGRSIDLGAVDPSVRARLLGLAIAELVGASWTELAANPRPEIAPASPAAPPEVRRAALAVVRRRVPGLGEDPGRSGRVLAVGAATAFFSGSGLLYGGGLRLGWDHLRHLGWSADVLAQHGSAATDLGPVSIDAVSAAGALLFHQGWSRLVLRLGGGFRGGLAYLVGQPMAPEKVQGGAVLGAWGGPTLTAGASVLAPRRLIVEADAEAGYVAFSVVGLVAGAPAVALDGPWLGVHVGIGIRP